LGALAILTRRFHRACVVLTVHGSDLRSAMAPIRWATAWAIGRAEAVIAVSPELADECRHARPGANVHFVPNGVELPKEGDLQALHACAPERPGRPHLVTVGRQVAERRHALLIRAFAEIRAEHPHATLTLVGDGPERETLEAVARECGVSNAVRFTGQVPTERVREYFLVGDLYVSPTTIESFGLSVAEAAACGLPVVTTRVGFPQRLVADGRTGRVVPPDNQVALTAAIRELLAAPEQLRAMGQRMRERLLEMGLTWKSCAARTRNVYRDALKRRGGGDD
jgi:glycosyltransferase involved in cell wall biosynthesis